MTDGNPEEKGTGKNVKKGRGNLAGEGRKNLAGEGRKNLAGKGRKNLARKGRKNQRERTNSPAKGNGESSQRKGRKNQWERTNSPRKGKKEKTLGEIPQRGVSLPSPQGAFCCGGKIILTEKKNGKVSVGERKRTGLPRKGKPAKGNSVAGKSHSVSLRENSVRRQENIKKTPRKIPGSFFVLDIGKVLLAVGQFDFVKQKFRGFALKRIVFFT